MIQKRKYIDCELNKLSKYKSNTSDNVSVFDKNDDLEYLIIPNDTEAALLYVKKILLRQFNYPFTPVILLNQVYSIIENKTVVNKDLKVLANQRKIIIYHLSENKEDTLIAFYNDLKDHVLNESNQKLPIYKKYFEDILANSEVGITKVGLIKFKCTESDIKLLINSGLLILRDVGYYWFSFPSAGTFVKNLKKGRTLLLNIIKRRKYKEILQSELEKKHPKNLYFHIEYHILDLIGGRFVHCVNTTSGKLLRIPRN